jgi:hypothetical protein
MHREHGDDSERGDDPTWGEKHNRQMICILVSTDTSRHHRRVSPASLEPSASLEAPWPLRQKKKRGSREQPPPPCHHATKPVKTPPLGAPVERINRRSREHRPTLGALEPPQVTPMCLLGDSRWHGRPSIEQRVIPTGERAKALPPTGDRRENRERKFNRSRVCKGSSVRNLLGCCR